jgi:hypothetical protein
MKRTALFLLLTSCLPTMFAGYSDGFITAGEYEYGDVIWRSYNPPLIVNGGGAERISVRDNGRLIVESTSMPLRPWWDPHPGGVYDILLGNNAQLLYKDGVTEYIALTQNNTATLKGGSINYIRTQRYATPENKNIFIYAQENSWSWINDDPMQGIEGNWLDDGTPFRIEFINMTDDGYDPVSENIEVIIPEPTTLVILGLGGLMLPKRQ